MKHEQLLFMVKFSCKKTWPTLKG